MNHLERCDLNTFTDTERSLGIDSVGDQLRKPAAKMDRLKDVLKDSSKIYPRDLVRKDRHCSVSKIQGADIVETENVIDMTMRDKHRVNAVDLRSEGLLPEIGGRVDENLFIVVFDEDRNAEAVIAGVL